MLEFILLNHPLDCPVCDKGGECPLQDLTYRYGPGNTRFHLNKRTYEKPLAISPLIALDRERCILCYRCTRFSQDVAQDEQLVARERGAGSVIATFEEEPYRGRFSGNVIELCPVGALTSTTYRFKARPWEINNIPSVCGICAVGCNTWGTVREGDVQRVLSRNHPEVDEGWLCDRGRFTHDHLRAGDRYVQGLVRGPRGLEPAGAEQLAETIARRLRHHASLHGADSIAVVASGEQSNEEAHAWAELVARRRRRRARRLGLRRRRRLGRARAVRRPYRRSRPRRPDRRRGRARAGRRRRRARAARAPGRPPRRTPAAGGQRRQRPRPRRRAGASPAGESPTPLRAASPRPC